MNLKFYRMLMAPEGESSSGGGGGFSASALADALFDQTDESNSGDKPNGNGRVQRDSLDGGKSDSGSPDNDRADDDVRSKDGKRSGSILFDSIRQVEDEEDDSEDSDQEESPKQKRRQEKDDQDDTQDDDQKGEKKEVKWDGKRPLTDEELQNLELDNKGKPLHAQPAAAFKAMKARLAEKDAEIKKLQSGGSEKTSEELSQLKSQLTEKETEIKKLKQEIDDEYYERSEGFQEAFKKPVDQSVQGLKKYFEKYTQKDYPDERQEIITMFSEAASKAANGEEHDFLEIIDEMSEKFVSGGSVKKTAFAAAAMKYYEAQKALSDALVEKGENRKKIVEDKISRTRQQSVGTIERDLDNSVRAFEAENKRYIDNLPEKMRADFQSKYQNAVKDIKADIASYAATGKLPPSLHEVIAKGATFEAVVHQKNMWWSAFTDSINKNKMLEEQVSELKNRLSRYTREPGKRDSVTSSRSSERNEGSSKKMNGSAIGNALAAVLEEDDG